MVHLKFNLILKESRWCFPQQTVPCYDTFKKLFTSIILSPLRIAHPCTSSKTQSPCRIGTNPATNSSTTGCTADLVTRPPLVNHEPQGYKETTMNHRTTKKLLKLHRALCKNNIPCNCSSWTHMWVILWSWYLLKSQRLEYHLQGKLLWSSVAATYTGKKKKTKF